MVRITTDEAPAAIGPYSQAWLAGTTLYISGQIPVDPVTGEIPEGIAAQTAQSCKNIGAILREAQGSYANVVKTTCFLADMADFAAMNAVYAEFFTAPYPARAAFQAACLPRNALVEIECIAVK